MAASEIAQLQTNLSVVERWSANFRLLGDPTRLRLLVAIHFAGQSKLTVTELAEATGLRLATASAALRAMETAGALTSHRDGRKIRYAIADEKTHDLLHFIGSGHAHEH